MAQAAVREIRIVGRSEGLTELARDVRAVGQAHDETAKSAEATARVTDTTTRRMVSTEGAYNRLMATMDASTRASQQLERAQRTLDRAFEQSIIDTTQYARAMDMLNAKYDASTIAAQRDAQAAAGLRAQIDPLAAAQSRLNAEVAEYSGLASRGAITTQEFAQAQAAAQKTFDQTSAAIRRQNGLIADNDNFAKSRRQNMTYQLFDIGQSGFGGMNPAMILTQQGPQIVQLYAGQGGVNAALEDMVGLLGSAARVAGPVAVALGALALGVRDWQNEFKKATGQAITFGDTLKAIFQVIGKSLMDGIEPVLDWLGPYFQTTWNFVKDVTGIAFNGVVAAVLTAVETIKFGIQALPAAFKSVGVWAANAFIDGINWMVEKALTAINSVIDAINFITSAGDSGLGKFKVEEFAIPSLEEPKRDADQLREKYEKFLETLDQINKTDYLKQFKEEVEKQAGKNAADRAAEAFKKQKQAIDDTVKSLRLEVETFGQTEGAIARAKFEMEQFAAAKEQAAKNKTVFDMNGTEARYIREMGAEIETLTNRLKELGEAFQRNQAIAEQWADLSFEQSLIGLTDAEKTIRRTLDQLQVGYNTEEGQALAGELRHLDALHKVEDQLNEVRDAGKDAFMDIVDAIGEGENAIDALMGALAQLGRKFTQMGAEKLFDGLTGKGWGGATAPAVAGTANKIAEAFTAPVGAVERRPLAPIDVNITTGSIKNYMAAIRQIESGGNYSAQGPVMRNGDRAYGAYQVMGNNIASWTKEVLGTSMTVKQFLQDKGAQDAVAGAKLQQSINKFGTFSDAAAVWFSGQPLSVSANRSDGFNTVSQYVKKANDALGRVSIATDALPDAVETGAIKGTNAGVQQGIQGVSGGPVTSDPWNSGGVNFRQQGGAPQQGGGGLLGGGGGGLGMIGMGLGSFAQGYQSGSPAGGGLSGALAGFSMGGPVGAVLGGVAGLFGGIFGKSRQRKQEQEAAKKQLKEQMGAIEELLDYASGTVSGGINSAVRKFTDETTKAIELANKAGDRELAKRLKASVGELEARLIKDFRDAYEGTIEGMNLGLSTDNPFKQGFDAVKALREELLAFVDDAKTAGLALDEAAQTAAKGSNWAANDNSLYRDPRAVMAMVQKYYQTGDATELRALDPKKIGWSTGDLSSAQKSQYQDIFNDAKRSLAAKDAADAADQAAEAERKLSDARLAAVNQALSTLSGPSELTEIEQQLMELRGKAAALPPVLKDLGMGAEEASRAIESHLAIAVAKLKDQYVADVTRSINDLSGLGFINEIVDAQDTYKQRLKDAAAVGLDGSLALAELNLSIADIARSADLTDDQLKMLAQAFPELATSLLGALDTETVAQAQAAVERARSDLRAAYEKEASALEQTIERTKDFIKSTTDLKNALKVDNNLSPLSGYDRFLEAQKQFRDVSAKAMGGDEDAMAQLEGVSREYLDEARSYYASSESYYRAFDEVQGILDKSLSSAQQQLAKDEQQLTVLKDQVGKLIDIDNSVKSVVDAIAALAAAQKVAAGAASAAIGGTKGASNEDIARAYNDLLGRAPDKAGQAYYENAAAGGRTADQIRSDIAGSREAEVNKLYKEILGRNADAGGSAYYTGSGKSIEQIRKDLEWAKAHGSYASGGYTGDLGRGDIAGIVHGQEFVMNAAATARWRPQFEAMNAGRMPAGGRDTSAIVAELRAVKAELAEIKAGQRQHITITAHGAVAVKEAIETGNGAQQTLANTAKRRSAA